MSKDEQIKRLLLDLITRKEGEGVALTATEVVDAVTAELPDAQTNEIEAVIDEIMASDDPTAFAAMFLMATEGIIKK